LLPAGLRIGDLRARMTSGLDCGAPLYEVPPPRKRRLLQCGKCDAHLCPDCTVTDTDILRHADDHCRRAWRWCKECSILFCAYCTNCGSCRGCVTHCQGNCSETHECQRNVRARTTTANASSTCQEPSAPPIGLDVPTTALGFRAGRSITAALGLDVPTTFSGLRGGSRSASSAHLRAQTTGVVPLPLLTRTDAEEGMRMDVEGADAKDDGYRSGWTMPGRRCPRQCSL